MPVVKVQMIVLQIRSNIVSQIRDGMFVFVYCIQELMETVADIVYFLSLIHDFILLHQFLCVQQTTSKMLCVTYYFKGKVSFQFIDK